jgi:hypothetical protein
MAATYAALADPVSAVVDLLSNNWTEVASGVGTTPTIDESWDIGKKNLKNGDIIRCYETSAGHDILGIGKGIDKHTSTVTIDIATATSRARLRALYQGVVHIIHAAHSDSLEAAPFSSHASTSDYASIRLLGRTDQSDKLRRWYRYVLNCEITSYEVVN